MAAQNITPEQFQQYIKLQEEVNRNKNLPATANVATNNSAPGQKTNRSNYPEPSQPSLLDEYGWPQYIKPLPDVDDTKTQLYNVYTPHLPYLAYSSVNKNKHGGKVVYQNLYKDSGLPLRIQLCGFDEIPLRAPFGAQVSKDRDGNVVGDPDRPNLELTIENEGLLKFLTILDRVNVEKGVSRKDRWFNPDINAMLIEALYKKIVTHAKPKEGQPKRDFKPTVRVKITLKGEGATRVYLRTGGDNGKWKLKPVHSSQVTLDLLKAGIRCIPIVDMTGLWFMSKEFGQSLSCVDLILVPRPPRKACDFVGADVEMDSEVNPANVTTTTTSCPVPGKSEETRGNPTPQYNVPNMADFYDVEESNVDPDAMNTTA